MTIFGSARCVPGDPLYLLAYDLGYACAQRGWVVRNGGYGGTMEAAARGAAAAGGASIGVVVRSFRGREPNRFSTQRVWTPNLFARLQRLTRGSQAFVVLPGGTGTLVELALTAEMFAKGLLPRLGVPLILLGEYWRPVIEVVRREADSLKRLTLAATVADVVAVLATREGQAEAGGGSAAVRAHVSQPAAPSEALAAERRV
ncbi:MAG: LOG family protein [Phycisphaerae bacterium]